MPSNNEYKIITNGNAIEIIDRVNNFIKTNGGVLILFHPTYRNDPIGMVEHPPTTTP